MYHKRLNHDEKIQLAKYILIVWITALLLKTVRYIIAPNTISEDISFSFIILNLIKFLILSANAVFAIWFFIHRILKNQKSLKNENYRK